MKWLNKKMSGAGIEAGEQSLVTPGRNEKKFMASSMGLAPPINKAKNDVGDATVLNNNFI